MKRSDMVTLITFAIYNNSLRSSCMETRPVAEKVLQAIEAAGMLPPKFTYIPGNPDKASEVGSGVRYAWEKEE